MNPAALPDPLIARLHSLLDRFETLLPVTREPDWDKAKAFRWRRQRTGFGVAGHLQPVRNLSKVRLADLKKVDQQKESIERNTRP